MDMNYNIDYDMAALILLLIEMVYLRIQYSHDKYSNRLFIMLLHSSFLVTVVDIASSLMLTGFSKVIPSFALKIVFSLYFLLNALVVLVFYRYIVEFLEMKKEITVGYYIRTYLPFVFIVECIVANCFANVFFTIGKHGHFSYGSLIYVIYIYPIYYYILTLVNLYRNRVRISIRQHFSVIAYIVINIASMFIQLFFADILSMSFGYAISLLIMLMSLETPDYKKFKEANEALDSVREKMEQRDYFNKALIKNISEEIAWPVNQIIEQSSAPDESDTNFSVVLSDINGYGKQIQNAFNNYAEFLNRNFDDRKSTPEEYSLIEIVNSIKDIMEPSLRHKSNTLYIDLRSMIPAKMCGDKAGISQIIYNLVSDANKYTEGGSIILSLYCKFLEFPNVNLVLSVEDDGIGMKRDMVKQLIKFNYKKIDWKNDIFTDGNFKAGITKKIAEQLDGKFNVDSVAGKGSVFTVIIPQEIMESTQE